MAAVKNSVTSTALVDILFINDGGLFVIVEKTLQVACHLNLNSRTLFYLSTVFRYVNNQTP